MMNSAEFRSNFSPGVNTSSLQTGAWPEMANVRLFLVTFCIIISFVSVTANSLVCLAYYLRLSLRADTSNKFLVSLALADLLNGLITIPLMIGGMFFHEIAQYSLAFATILLLATMTNICAITWDRHCKIFSPFLYVKQMDSSRVKMIFLMVWIIPIPIGVSLFLVLRLKGPDSITYKTILGIFDSLFIALSMLICYMYYLLLRESARHAKDIMKQKNSIIDQSSSTENVCDLSTRGTQRGRGSLGTSPTHSDRSTCSPWAEAVAVVMRDRKALKVCAVVVITFLITWYPAIAYDLCVLGGIKNPVADIVTMCTAMMNIVLDPIIYSLYKQDFKFAIRRLLADTSTFMCFQSLIQRNSQGSNKSASSSTY